MRLGGTLTTEEGPRLYRMMVGLSGCPVGASQPYQTKAIALKHTHPSPKYLSRRFCTLIETPSVDRVGGAVQHGYLAFSLVSTMHG